MLQPSEYPCGLPLSPLQYLHILLVLEDPDLDTGASWGQNRGTVTSLALQPPLCKCSPGYFWPPWLSLFHIHSLISLQRNVSSVNSRSRHVQQCASENYFFLSTWKSNFSVTLDTFQQFIKPIRILTDTSSSWEEKQTKVTSNSTSNQSSRWFCIMIWRLKREVLCDWMKLLSIPSFRRTGSHPTCKDKGCCCCMCHLFDCGRRTSPVFQSGSFRLLRADPKQYWVKREKITHHTAPQA